MKIPRAIRTAILLAGSLCFSSCWLNIQWQQFHGDPANQGMTLVKTSLLPKEGWQANLGQTTSYSTPVLDSNGNIYACTYSLLSKVSPNGIILWQKDFAPAFTLTSPAIGPNDNIFIVTSTELSRGLYWNELHCVLPNGNQSWARNFGVQQDMFTTSSPKVWGSLKRFHVFIRLRQKLYAFSSDGRMVAAGEIHNHCTTIYGTSWFMDILEDIWYGLKHLFRPVSFPINALDFFDLEKWPDPTVALSSDGLPEFAASPLVVVADPCGMAAFQWDPDAETFRNLWLHNHGDAANLTSPVISKTGELAVGRQDGDQGIVELYDLVTDLQTPTKIGEFKLHDEFLGSAPASWLGMYFYIATRHTVFKIDGLGNLISQADLYGETLAPPALSLEGVVISTTSGLEGFDLALEQHWLREHGGEGIVSAAIGNGGELYSLDVAGRLRAYK